MLVVLLVRIGLCMILLLILRVGRLWANCLVLIILWLIRRLVLRVCS